METQIHPEPVKTTFSNQEMFVYLFSKMKLLLPKLTFETCICHFFYQQYKNLKLVYHLFPLKEKKHVVSLTLQNFLIL